MASTAEPKPLAKNEVGKVHEGTDPKPGFVPLGGAYEGRKRPDGLGRGWQ